MGATEAAPPSGAGWGRSVASLLELPLSTPRRSTQATIRSLRFSSWLGHAMTEGWLVPALEAAAGVQGDLAAALTGSLRDGTGWRGFWEATGSRLAGALRFSRLVSSFGRDQFGSAVFPGETVIAEDACFRLSYLPPEEGTQQAPFSLFHAGGAIPYGDRIFRLLPGCNFYDRFRERGVPVYAMELKGDRRANDTSRLDLDGHVDSLTRLSDAAAAHAGDRKLVLEGYCGSGTQALAYLCARPEDADAKFAAFATFVAPIDASRCGMLADAIRATPPELTEAQHVLSSHLGGYVPADQTRLGIDLALRAVFFKTVLGYLSVGWHRTDLAAVRDATDLTPGQRRDLAGTYWVSPACCRRYPVPVGISRATSALFTHGIARDGTLPWTVGGRPLSLRALAERTKLRVLGFYGGRDSVVPDSTAHVLMPLLGDRYTHVVHPEAGHISYVLSPRLWGSEHPLALSPNPIDLLLEACAAPAGKRRKK